MLGEIAQLQAQVELVTRQLRWASDAAMASIPAMPHIQELLYPQTQPYGPPPPELCGRPYQDHVHDVAILRLSAAICCIDSTVESLHVRPLALLWHCFAGACFRPHPPMQKSALTLLAQMSNALLQPPSVELVDSLSKSRAIMIMELCAKLLVNCLKYLPEERRARLSAVCEWLIQKPQV